MLGNSINSASALKHPPRIAGRPRVPLCLILHLAPHRFAAILKWRPVPTHELCPHHRQLPATPSPACANCWPRRRPCAAETCWPGWRPSSAEERVAAQFALADLPLAHFLAEQVVPYETDEVTRLIVDTHDAEAFAPVRSLTVGELRDWLLSDEATGRAPGRACPRGSRRRWPPP